MPFKSQAQWRAAFSGALGEEMKAHADAWAKETPNGYEKLPARVGTKKKVARPCASEATLIYHVAHFMIWHPWRRCSELEAQLRNSLLAQANSAARVELLREDRDYWKRKAEILLDNALLRKGETASPIFAPPPSSSTEQTLGSIFGPLAVTEIESGKRRARGDDGASRLT